MRKFLKKSLLFVVFMFTALLLFACKDKKEKIVIRGSTSVEPVMNEIIAAYEKTEDGKKVEFDVLCQGSGKGRAAAENDITGNVLGMSSSAIKDADKDKFHELLLANDAIAIIVHKDNPIETLTVEEVYDIYTGARKKFKDGEKEIAVIARDAASGTREAFEDLIKDKDGNKLKATKMVATAEELEKTSAVIASVKGNKQAIGYVSLGSLPADGVKVLKINDVEPNAENVTNDTYKLYRPFVLVVNKQLYAENKLTEVLNKFLKYLATDAVQAIVAKKGFVKVEQ